VADYALERLSTAKDAEFFSDLEKLYERNDALCSSLKTTAEVIQLLATAVITAHVTLRGQLKNSQLIAPKQRAIVNRLMDSAGELRKNYEAVGLMEKGDHEFGGEAILGAAQSLQKMLSIAAATSVYSDSFDRHIYLTQYVSVLQKIYSGWRRTYKITKHVQKTAPERELRKDASIYLLMMYKGGVVYREWHAMMEDWRATNNTFSLAKLAVRDCNRRRGFRRWRARADYYWGIGDSYKKTVKTLEEKSVWKYLDIWLVTVREILDQMRICKKFATRFRQAGLIWALTKWHEEIMDKLYYANRLKRGYMASLTHSGKKLLQLWFKWSADAREYEKTVSRIRNNLRSNMIGRALGMWRDGVALEMEQKEVCGRVMQLLKNRLVIGGLNLWRENISEMLRQQEVMRRCCEQILRAKIQGAFNKWYEHVVEMEAGIELCKRVMQRFVTMALRSAFLSWHTTVMQSVGLIETLKEKAKELKTSLWAEWRRYYMIENHQKSVCKRVGAMLLNAFNIKLLLKWRRYRMLHVTGKRSFKKGIKGYGKTHKRLTYIFWAQQSKGFTDLVATSKFGIMTYRETRLTTNFMAWHIQSKSAYLMLRRKGGMGAKLVAKKWRKFLRNWRKKVTEIHRHLMAARRGILFLLHRMMSEGMEVWREAYQVLATDRVRMHGAAVRYSVKQIARAFFAWEVLAEKRKDLQANHTKAFNIQRLSLEHKGFTYWRKLNIQAEEMQAHYRKGRLYHILSLYKKSLYEWRSLTIKALQAERVAEEETINRLLRLKTRAWERWLKKTELGMREESSRTHAIISWAKRAAGIALFSWRTSSKMKNSSQALERKGESRWNGMNLFGEFVQWRMTARAQVMSAVIQSRGFRRLLMRQLYQNVSAWRAITHYSQRIIATRNQAVKKYYYVTQLSALRTLRAYAFNHSAEMLRVNTLRSAIDPHELPRGSLSTLRSNNKRSPRRWDRGSREEKIERIREKFSNAVAIFVGETPERGEDKVSFGWKWYQGRLLIRLLLTWRIYATQIKRLKGLKSGEVASIHYTISTLSRYIDTFRDWAYNENFRLTKDRSTRLKVSRMGRAWLKWETFSKFRKNKALGIESKEDADYAVQQKAFRRWWAYAWETQNKLQGRRRAIVRYVIESLKTALGRWRSKANYKDRRLDLKEKEFVSQMVQKAKARYGNLGDTARSTGYTPHYRSRASSKYMGQRSRTPSSYLGLPTYRTF